MCAGFRRVVVGSFIVGLAVACGPSRPSASTAIALRQLDSVIAHTSGADLTLQQVQQLAEAQRLIQRGVRPVGDSVTLGALATWAAHEGPQAAARADSLRQADSTRAVEEARARDAAAEMARHYAAYAEAIQRDGDSVLTLMNARVTSDVGVNTMVIAEEMRRKAGDFEAVAPPGDLATIHQQMVSALRRLAAAYERRADRMKEIEGDCAVEAAYGSCDATTKTLKQAAVLVDEGRDAPFSDYNHARSRAAKALAAHGIELPN